MMTPYIGDELIERGATVLRPADAAVDILHGRVPAAGRDVPPKFLQLVLRLLVDGRDPRVDRDLHASTSPSVVPTSERADCGRSASDVMLGVMVLLREGQRLRRV